MAIPLIIAGIGAAMQIYGNYQANMNQAEAEFANAKFYEEQANYVRDAMNRELSIASSEYTYKIGSQISSMAKGGVDVGSGSAFNTITASAANKVNELLAIRKKAELDHRLAQGRRASSLSNAEYLSSTETNVLQAGGTALTAYAGAKS